MLTTIFTIAFVACAVADIPSYIHVCGRRNPDLNACVLQHAIELKGKLRNGMPELSIPSMEPINVDRIPLTNTDTFKAVVRNAKLYGLSDFQITELDLDLDRQRLDVDLVFEKLTWKAELEVSATIVVSLGGKGVFNGVTDGAVAKVTLEYQLQEMNGQKHMFFSSMATKLILKGLTSHFVPEEGENSPLAVSINSVLDSMRPDIIKEFTPYLEEAIVKYIREMANKICEHLSYDEMFPDHE